MNLLWRFLWVILFSRFESPLTLSDEASISFRVMPTDIDILMHMNNGRYFSFLDLARINFMIRTKYYFILQKQKIYGVVASEMMRFRKSIELFQRFEISSQILGWDDKFIFVAQQVKVKNEICALALVKIRFIKQGVGSLNPTEIMEALSLKVKSPKLPTWVDHWQKADKQFYDDVMK